MDGREEPRRLNSLFRNRPRATRLSTVNGSIEDEAESVELWLRKMAARRIGLTMSAGSVVPNVPLGAGSGVDKSEEIAR